MISADFKATIKQEKKDLGSGWCILQMKCL